MSLSNETSAKVLQEWTVAQTPQEWLLGSGPSATAPKEWSLEMRWLLPSDPQKGPLPWKQLLGDSSSAVAPEEQFLGTSPSGMFP